MFSSYLDFRFVLHDKSDFQREFPFCSGFPIGASSIPVGTRLSPESLVCYTFVQQMAAGAVAHLGKLATVAAFWRERLPLTGRHERQKKDGRRCEYALSAILVICGTKVYQSLPSAVAYHRIRTTTAASRADCPSPRPQPSSSGSRSNENGVLLQSAGARFHR